MCGSNEGGSQRSTLSSKFAFHENAVGTGPVLIERRDIPKVLVVSTLLLRYPFGANVSLSVPFSES